MTRYAPCPPQWPPTDDETAAAIGRVVIAWGMLEFQIDETIGDLHRFEPTLQMSVLANLGTKAKLEIFQSSVSCLKDLFDKDIVDAANKLANQTSSASTNHRLFAAHGQPTAFENSPKEPIWLWTRFYARKGGPKGIGSRLTPHIFQRSEDEIKQLVDRWYVFRLRIKNGTRTIDWMRTEVEASDGFD